MSADLSQAMDSLYSELKGVEARSIEIKKMLNNLSAMLGKEPPFQNIETGMVLGNQPIRPGQFFGKGLSTAVKEYLKMRNQACTAQQIFDALKIGGFEFPKDWTEKYQMRNITISLSKNSYDFVYVKSSNSYGLWEFYPEKQRERKKQKAKQLKGDPSEPDESQQDEEQDPPVETEITIVKVQPDKK